MTTASHGASTPTRWSWLFLVSAAALLSVANGRWQLPLAAWLSPVFLLLFIQSHRSLTGLALAYLVQLAAFFVNWWEIIPLPGVWYFVAAGVYATVYFTPFVIHRLLATADHRFRSTLILPMSWVSVELLVEKFTPYGSWSALGYTQIDLGPLLQVASVAGLAGISFLMLWFSAVCVWMWQHRHLGAHHLSRSAVFLALFVCILLVGDFVLWSKFDMPTMRVASLTPSAELTGQLYDAMNLLDPETLGDEEFDNVEELAARVNSDLLSRSRIEAMAGAEVIVWAEHAARVTGRSEPELILQAREIAQQYSALLVLGVGVWHPDQAPGFENKAVIITSDGVRAADYHKAKPIVGQESAILEQGTQGVAIIDRGEIRLAVAICHDLDFPDFMRQVGKQNVDILLGPSSDWGAITPLHPRMAIVRAVENGCSLVRPCSNGLSLAVDPLGRVLSRQLDNDHRGTVMISEVPMGRRSTLVSSLGNFFAYANLITLAVVLAVSMFRLLARRFESVHGVKI